jgi:hypothetical protein
MKWRIDQKQKLLIINEDYEIGFDRLKENGWLEHLAQKNWVKMDSLFKAFVAAYKAAGIPLSKHFFDTFHAAYMVHVDSRFYDLIFNLRYADENKLFYKAADLKSEQALIEEIVA